MRRLIFAFMLLFTAAACDNTPETDPRLEKMNDLYRGTYVCKSAIFQGDALDLNNDGTCSKDFMAELNSLINCGIAFRYNAVVYPASEFGTEMSFSIPLPLHNISYNKLDEEIIKPTDGSYTMVPFYYSFTEDGTSHVRFNNEAIKDQSSDESDIFRCFDCRYAKIKEVNAFGNGKISFTAEGMYYDFKTNKTVQGTVLYVYERESYAI